MAKKNDLIKQNEAMRDALNKSRAFIILTLVGIGFSLETCPKQFKALLQEIDNAAGFNERPRIDGEAAK